MPRPSKTCQTHPNIPEISDSIFLQLGFLMWVTFFDWVMADFREREKKETNFGLHYVYQKTI